MTPFINEECPGGIDNNAAEEPIADPIGNSDAPDHPPSTALRDGTTNAPAVQVVPEGAGEDLRGDAGFDAAGEPLPRSHFFLWHS